MRTNEVKALTDVEHVQHRPSMYIGSTQLEKLDRWVYNEEQEKFQYRQVEFVPGLLKLFDEVVSNSIDEALRTDFKHANKIDVQLHEDHIIVKDNGRGIPTGPSAIKGVSQAEMALTMLRAGSNFTHENVVSIGTHGLGVSLVNILSSKFSAWTDDGSNRVIVECSDGMNKKKVKTVPSTVRGTNVEFHPDFSRFGSDEISDDLLSMMHKRIIDLATCFPKIRFRVNGQIIKAKKFEHYVQMVGDVYEYIETDHAKIAVVASDEPNQISFVNGIDTYEGGTHVDFVRNQVVGDLLERLKKKNRKLDLKPGDVRNKLTFIVITNEIKAPKFRSQSKEYVTNHASSYEGILDNLSDTVLVKRLARNADIVDPIVETKKLKLKAAEAVELKKKQRKIKKIKVAKHTPATKPGATLFLTEGQSASGTLTEVRDVEKHGCYPLRGKPMNTYGMKGVDILKNKEFQELMSIVGLSFNTETMDDTYQEIAILADADHDGQHITGLLLTFFSHWVKLFEDKRICIVRCPIMIVRKGSKSHRIFDFRTYDEMRKSGEIDSTWKIDYYKGLGSLPLHEYERMIHQPNKVYVDPLDEGDLAKIQMAFGGDADKRKEWLK